MRKKFFIIEGIILLMLASGTLSAQSNKAIKDFAQSARSHKNIEVSFTYKITGDPKHPEDTKEGKAYVQDKAFKVILDDQQTISDGKTIWRYLIEDEEVMIGDATDDDNPFKILDDIEKDSSGITPLTDKNGELKGFEMNLDEGIHLILNITDLKYDQDFPKKFFSFDEKSYPDVEIIDMR